MKVEKTIAHKTPTYVVTLDGETATPPERERIMYLVLMDAVIVLVRDACGDLIEAHIPDVLHAKVAT